MKVAALCLALLVAAATSNDVARVRRGQRGLRKKGAPESAFMYDAAADQDSAFWERELGKNGSHGKGKGGSKGSKGGSKSKGGSSKSKGKGHRVLAETNFMNENAIEEKEAVDFWNRELGGNGSHGKGKGGSKGSKGSKGGSKSKGGSSKSKGKGHRRLTEENDTLENTFMRDNAADKEAIDFWNRELGKNGSHGKGKGSSKGSKGGSKSKGGSSKSKGKGHRKLAQTDFMQENVVEQKEAMDFWNRELGGNGSHGKGKGSSKGSKGGSKSKGSSSKSKGKGKGHRA